MDAEDARSIGRRIREIRVWRGMNLRAAAELAGISESYLSRIERGERSIDRRSLLEAIAVALRVAPSELAEQAFPPPARPVVGEATITELESALADLELGTAGGEARPWAAVVVDLDRLNNDLRPRADYAAQSHVLPGLLRELHTLYLGDDEHRLEVLRGLTDCYHATAFLTKILGLRGLPTLAAFQARRVAEDLDDPAWLGLATWLRAQTSNEPGRWHRMLELSVKGADALEHHLDDDRARQVYGALHLNAALASAAMRQSDDAQAHLNTAGTVADSVGRGHGRGFGSLCFGPDNVGIWRVSIAVELGDPGRAHELARDVSPEQVPSAARQATFWADRGRGMSTEKATRERAVLVLRRAEDVAPQHIRTNPFVRETVADLMRRRARHDAVGRELRGMASRMGLAVG